MEKSLVQIVQSSNLEPQESKSIIDKFQEYDSIAKEWETKARMIVVSNEEQITEMKMAGEARKKFSKMRIDVEKTRKELKEQSLRKGQAIDAIAKYLTSLIEPIEKYLKEQEDFVEIKQKREAEIKRLEEEKRLEDERLAKLEADRIEQERVRKENEQLRKEAIEKEKALEEERAKAREAQLKAESNARIEKEKIEAEARKQKEEADRLIQAEKAEKEKALELLNSLVKCPHCGKDFNLPKAPLS